MELRRRIVDLLFFFLSDQWGLKGCEERRTMMMVVRMERGFCHTMRG